MLLWCLSYINYTLILIIYPPQLPLVTIWKKLAIFFQFLGFLVQNIRYKLVGIMYSIKYIFGNWKFKVHDTCQILYNDQKGHHILYLFFLNDPILPTMTRQKEAHTKSLDKNIIIRYDFMLLKVRPMLKSENVLNWVHSISGNHMLRVNCYWIIYKNKMDGTVRPSLMWTGNRLQMLVNRTPSALSK